MGAVKTRARWIVGGDGAIWRGAMLMACFRVVVSRAWGVVRGVARAGWARGTIAR